MKFTDNFSYKRYNAIVKYAANFPHIPTESECKSAVPNVMKWCKGVLKSRIILLPLWPRLGIKGKCCMHIVKLYKYSLACRKPSIPVKNVLASYKRDMISFFK